MGEGCVGGNCMLTQPPLPNSTCTAAGIGPMDGLLYALQMGVVGAGFYAKSPGASTWTALPNPPYALGDAAGTMGPDNKFYTFGQYIKGFVGSTTNATVYDPVAQAWSQLTMPTHRMDAAAVTGPDGMIYVIGGQQNTGPANTMLSSVDVYDPTTSTWSTAPSMPTPRRLLSAAVGKDGRIYAIGGSSTTINFPGVTPLATVEAFDPVAQQWSAVPDMPTARAQPGAALGADGLLYVMGGLNSAAVAVVEAYDVTTSTWNTVAPMQVSSNCPGGTAAPHADPVYAVGGTGSATQTYYTASMTWN